MNYIKQKDSCLLLYRVASFSFSFIGIVVFVDATFSLAMLVNEWRSPLSSKLPSMNLEALSEPLVDKIAPMNAFKTLANIVVSPFIWPSFNGSFIFQNMKGLRLCDLMNADAVFLDVNSLANFVPKLLNCKESGPFSRLSVGGSFFKE